MLHGPITVPPTISFGQLTELLSTTAQRQFPVVDEGRYLAIVDADVVAPFETRVSDLMEEIDAVAPCTPLDTIAAIDTRTTAAVAVVDGGAVVGLVQLHDVARLAQRVLSGRAGTAVFPEASTSWVDRRPA
jgi:predicted transcriptional regulator